MNEKWVHQFDLSLEINLGVSYKCKLCTSHHRMKQVLNKFRIKWRLSSYFSLPGKLLLIQSGIFAPIRAPPGRFNNIVLIQTVLENLFYSFLTQKHCSIRDVNKIGFLMIYVSVHVTIKPVKIIHPNCYFSY